MHFYLVSSANVGVVWYNNIMDNKDYGGKTISKRFQWY